MIEGEIKIAREQKHLTQEQLSEIIDISPMHMNVIENVWPVPGINPGTKFGSSD